MPEVALPAVERTPLLHTIDQTLALVPISKTSLRKMIADGTLPSVVIAGRRLIRHADLVALAERGER